MPKAWFRAVRAAHDMGVRLSNLPSAIKQAYPAATKSGSVVEEAAVLDVAFDHLLYGLHERGVYEAVGLTLKGGTALRKYHLGHRSRFSFDLDFDAEEGADELVAEEIDGMAFRHFEFTSHERRGHYSTRVATDLLSGRQLEAKIDFSTRGLWLPPGTTQPCPHPGPGRLPVRSQVPSPGDARRRERGGKARSLGGGASHTRPLRPGRSEHQNRRPAARHPDVGAEKLRRHGERQPPPAGRACRLDRQADRRQALRRVRAR